MQRNQTTPVKIVSRSRFRSTTDDEPSEELCHRRTGPTDPPPLPLCSSTSTIISRLVMMRTTEIPITTADSRPSGCFDARAQASHGQFTVPADPDELTGIEAGPADQRTVNVWLRHDRSDVVGLHRPAIQDTHIEGHIVPVNRGNPLPDRLAHLLRVLRRGHLAGADRPDRLVGDDQAGDLLRADAIQRAVQLGQGVRRCGRRPRRISSSSPTHTIGVIPRPQRGPDLRVHQWRRPRRGTGGARSARPAT